MAEGDSDSDLEEALILVMEEEPPTLGQSSESSLVWDVATNSIPLM